MSLILIKTLFYKASLLEGEIWCWSLLGEGLTVKWKKKVDPEQPFSSLRRWLSWRKNSEVILSHTTNQLLVFKQLLYNFTLDRNILVHNIIRPILDSCQVRLWINKCRSSSWRGHYTSSYFKTITADGNITNTGKTCM